MDKFIDIKRKFNDFQSFFAWLNNQEFSELRKANANMDYCDLSLGNRNVQHRIYGLKHGLKNIFAPMMSNENFYTWESVFGEEKAKELAKKYNASIMEAPYCETEGQNIEFILVFNSFEGCAQFIWDTAEQYEKINELFHEFAGQKSLKEIYEMSLS